VVKLNTPKQLNATAAQALEIPGEIQTQVGGKSSYIFKNMLVLPGSAKYTQNGQSVTFVEKGTAYVMPRYDYTIAPNYTYTLYAEPLTVTIQ